VVLRRAHCDRVSCVSARVTSGRTHDVPPSVVVTASSRPAPCGGHSVDEAGGARQSQPLAVAMCRFEVPLPSC
jgi:hypothetical protein